MRMQGRQEARCSPGLFAGSTSPEFLPGGGRWQGQEGAGLANFGSPTARSSHPQSLVGLWDRLGPRSSAGLQSTSALLPFPALL